MQMPDYPVKVDIFEEREVIHIYPLFGREHDTSGVECWCHPETDGTVTVHNVEN
jgi:hypothetical protein